MVSALSADVLNFSGRETACGQQSLSDHRRKRFMMLDFAVFVEDVVYILEGLFKQGAFFSWVNIF